MEVTLIYWANGGDSTPASDTKTITPPSTDAEFELSSPITKEYPTNKFLFKGWKIGETVYDAKAKVRLSASAVATAVFEINKTSVSTKDYGRSPNGTRNALGSTRFHHQPSYPHAMGVGAKKVGNPPDVPVPPTPPTIKEISVTEARVSGLNSGYIVGEYLDNIEHEDDVYSNKVIYYKKHGSSEEFTKLNGDARTSNQLRLFDVYWNEGDCIDVKLTSDANPITSGVPASKEYLFENIVVTSAYDPPG